MLNNATLKLRIDSKQAYMTGDELSVHGLASFKFRDRQQDQVGQIEFYAKGKVATQLQELGIGTVGIAIGRVDIYPEKPNNRIILEIKQFEPVAVPQTVAQPQPVPVPQTVAQPVPQTVTVPVPVAATGIAKLPF